MHDGAEDDRRDDHLDRLDKHVAERLQLGAKRRIEISQQHADRDRAQNLEIEMPVNLPASARLCCRLTWHRHDPPPGSSCPPADEPESLSFRLTETRTSLISAPFYCAPIHPAHPPSRIRDSKLACQQLLDRPVSLVGRGVGIGRGSGFARLA